MSGSSGTVWVGVDAVVFVIVVGFEMGGAHSGCCCWRCDVHSGQRKMCFRCCGRKVRVERRMKRLPALSF